jgi:aminoglycoside phosphotransferase (APT) family kinase protein
MPTSQLTIFSGRVSAGPSRNGTATYRRKPARYRRGRWVPARGGLVARAMRRCSLLPAGGGNRFDIAAHRCWGSGVTLHEDEIEIDLPLVRALVDRALPDFAGYPLRRLETSGSSNVLYRLGADLLVRLPRQPRGSETVTKEARWLPYVAPALPVAVPTIVAVGEPDVGYPERWSVVRWLDGELGDAPIGPAAAAHGLARDLADVVVALGELAVPSDALADPALRWYRGEPLGAMDAAMKRYLAECRRLPALDLDVDACLRVWEAAVVRAGTVNVVAPRWLHGDLLAENLLLREGGLSAVLDFGGLSVGDPTVDLVAGWDMLDSAAREAFRSALGVDDLTWERGRAWALAIAVMTFPYYWHTMPDRCAARLAMAHAVLADAGQ